MSGFISFKARSLCLELLPDPGAHDLAHVIAPDPIENLDARAPNVRFGSKADKPSRAKIQLCPLWSKSGQTRVRLDCPLCADCVAKVSNRGATIFPP
jgi:hypothetical protein